MAEIEEFPIKRELTATEAASYAERRGGKQGMVLFYDEKGVEGFCTFGSLKNADALWLLEMQKLVTLKLLDVNEI